MKNIIERPKELGELSLFVQKKGPGYVHVRGRRRVGKSELLKQLVKTRKNAFYFYGSMDESDSNSRDRFVQQFSKLQKINTLLDLTKTARTWDRILTELGLYFKKEKNCILILDEIQWISKKGSGFLGLLKHHWSEWKKTSNIKLILCGSSNKFFINNTDAEFNTLRGLKTHSDIWIQPFSALEVKNKFFSKTNWSYEQITLLYMMFGGVPYYLEQLLDESNFYRAVNKAAFTQSTIFLDEIYAVLNLEFNQKSIHNVISIMSSIGMQGSTMTQISRQTGMPKQTISDLIGKLIDYNIVAKKNPMQESIKEKKNATYHINDFFLNFYFTVLKPLKERIEKNSNKMIFNNVCITSKTGHHIDNFTGLAFENFVRYQLETSSEDSELYKKLSLTKEKLKIGTFSSKETQIDLIAESANDRESRLIEVKWTQNLPSSGSLEKEILNKKYSPPKGFNVSYFLVSAKEKPKKLKIVTHIGLKDLFK